MRKLVTLFGALIVLSSCAGSKTREAHWQKYDEAARKPASMGTHICVPMRGPNCRSKMVWHCPDGYVDGCNTAGGTGFHECVLKSGSLAMQEGTVPCTQELAMECGIHMKDACLSDREASVSDDE